MILAGWSFALHSMDETEESIRHYLHAYDEKILTNFIKYIPFIARIVKHLLCLLDHAMLASNGRLLRNFGNCGWNATGWTLLQEYRN